MEYADLVDVYTRLDDTDSNLELTAILADCFRSVEDDYLDRVVTMVRGQVFAAWESEELGVSSSLTTEAIRKATGVDADRLEAEWRDTGDLGDAAAWAVANGAQQTLVSRPLTVDRVYETLRELPAYEGEGSQERRVDAVASLLSDADPAAARYVVRTVLGHMRLGVGEGTIRDAVAEAFLDGSEDAVAAVERAYQVTNDYRVVARTAKAEGLSGLDGLEMELFRPVQVMLARKAEGLAAGVEDVAEGLEDVLLEHKYDGARVQLHVDGDEVRVFTRRLEDVTAQFPDVVAAVREHVTAERAILDGEAVGYDPETGEPVPFQEFSRRIKREYDVERLVAEIPVVVYLFDALSVAGASLLDAPLTERLDRLAAAFEPEPQVLERAAALRPTTMDEAERFYREALDAGREGVMLKNLAATYQPGSRVGYMMKAKPTMETLDLVVTRATWSEGRRSDNLGRLHLACRDEAAGAFREVGRLSTGYSDEELAELTARLEPLIRAEDGRTVELRPEVVLEVEYEEIQTSPEYGSGYALRFPRFEGVREDVAPADVDSLSKVERLYEGQ